MGLGGGQVLVCAEQEAESKGRERVIGANRASVRGAGGRKERERTRGIAEKRESKTTGKVGEKSGGRKPPECFFRSGGTKGYSMTGVGVR